MIYDVWYVYSMLLALACLPLDVWTAHTLVWYRDAVVLSWWASVDMHSVWDDMLHLVSVLMLVLCLASISNTQRIRLHTTEGMLLMWMLMVLSVLVRDDVHKVATSLATDTMYSYDSPLHHACLIAIVRWDEYVLDIVSLSVLSCTQAGSMESEGTVLMVSWPTSWDHVQSQPARERVPVHYAGTGPRSCGTLGSSAPAQV